MPEAPAQSLKDILAFSKRSDRPPAMKNARPFSERNWPRSTCGEGPARHQCGSDLLLVREPWQIEAEAVRLTGADGLSLAHVGKRRPSPTSATSAESWSARRGRGASCGPVSTAPDRRGDAELLDAADRRSGDDFEDNLQVESRRSPPALMRSSRAIPKVLMPLRSPR